MRRVAWLVPVALAVVALPARSAPVVHSLVDIPCRAAAGDDAPPYGTAACTGVRPGALMKIGEGDNVALCTFAFLAKGRDGRRYIATAGHCLLDEIEGERTWPGATGPAIRDATDTVIGHAAYARYAVLPDRTRADFALVRLDKGVAADPAMCHFGGPTGINTAIDDDFHMTTHVGQSLVGEVTPSRTGAITRGLFRPDYIWAWAAALNGDSGSPMTDSAGQAIGMITQQAAGPEGTVGVYRFGPGLDRAAQWLKTKLTLETAPQK